MTQPTSVPQARAHIYLFLRMRARKTQGDALPRMCDGAFDNRPQTTLTQTSGVSAD